MRIYLAILFLTALATFTPFCKKDPVNCQDEKVGDVYFSQEGLSFFAAETSQSLNYVNPIGELRAYAITQKSKRIPLHIEKLCESFNLSTHYRYYDGDWMSAIYRSGSDSILMEMSMVSCSLEGKKDTAFYEHLSILHFDGTGGAELTKIISTRGNESKIPQVDSDAQHARFIGDTTLLQTNFKNVYTGSVVSGSPTNAPHQIFFSAGIGLVGFTDASGTIWVKK